MATFTVRIRQGRDLTPHSTPKTAAKAIAGEMKRDSQKQKGEVNYCEVTNGMYQLTHRGVEEFWGPSQMNPQDRAIAKAIIFYILGATELPGALLAAIDTPSKDPDIATIAKQNIRIEVVSPDGKVKSVSPHKKPKANVPAKAKNKVPQVFRWNDGQKTAAAMAVGLFASSVPFLLISAWLPAGLLLGLCGIVAFGTKIFVKASQDNYYGVGILHIDTRLTSENERKALRGALIKHGFGRGIEYFLNQGEPAEFAKDSADKVTALIQANILLSNKTIRPFLSDDKQSLEFCQATVKVTWGFHRDAFEKAQRDGNPILKLRII